MLSAVAALGAVIPSMGQEGEPIQGYFRVQSALSAADNSGYVEVRGPFTTAPDRTLTQAQVSAGTVMRLRAFPETHQGKLRYKIGNLSSQGIEVFGAPHEDYFNDLVSLAGDINTSDFVAAAYGLQRVAAKTGYIATGRMLIQSVFQVVAGRLDNEISSLSPEVKEQLGIDATQESLEDFAIRFNREVAADLDLHAYLEPVAEGQYRLYFHWIDCTKVSEFYLANEQNKKSFELGFACMRQYMNNKAGLNSGERIDDREAALWKSWGYDISLKYSDLYVEGTDGELGYYQMSYEKIFADHEVLYNWLKMYIECFLDPDKAPDASILGINFKDFATEMQKHAIMQGFLKYIPSIQEGQRLYLSNGRFSDGVNDYSTVGTVSDNSNRFGLLATEQAEAAGNAAIWNVIPVDENTENYFAIDPVAHRVNKPAEDDGHLLAIYVDFPFEKIDGSSLKFKAIAETIGVQTIELENLGTVNYVELPEEEITMVPRTTAALVESYSEFPEDNIVRVIYEPQESDYDPEVSNDPGATLPQFPVTDEEVGSQHAPGKAEAGLSANAYGVLLTTPATESALKHMAGIDKTLTGKKVYDLTTREEQKSAETKADMRTPWFSEVATIPANHAFLIAPEGLNLSAVSLGVPADEAPLIPSAIEEVGVDTPLQPDVIYDLQGRRVSSVEPGVVYILNGKKIVVR